LKSSLRIRASKMRCKLRARARISRDALWQAWSIPTRYPRAKAD